MAFIGKLNTLRILHSAPPGYYLDGGPHGEILLPGRYIPKGKVPGDNIDVFIYLDSEDRLVATTETPLAYVGQFAFLRVVSVNPRLGTFLDWGLPKDLLLPMSEMTGTLRPDKGVVVYVTVDEKTNRIVASMRLSLFWNKTPPTYAEGRPVELLIAGETPLGYNAIINHAHLGLLYRSELRETLATGLRLDGYVRAVRPDGKIDLTLDQAGYERIKPLSEVVLKALEKNGGRLPYNDNSSPEEIRAAFGVSKNAFKQAIGALFRQQLIFIEHQSIRLVTAKPERS